MVTTLSEVCGHMMVDIASLSGWQSFGRSIWSFLLTRSVDVV